MKKNFWKLFVLAVACSVFVLGFVACGEEKHTHNYIETVTAPTCTDQGYTTYTCDCSDTYVDSYVDALGHEFTDYISDNNATYEIDGTKTAVCNRNCGATDTIPEPNTMIRDYKSVLILERNDNESDEIKNILEEDGHQTLVLNILKDDIPFTWQELSCYDQVILVNIANVDMPEGFIDELEYYVNDFGGSLLTVGGNDEYGEANSYNREDMYGTLYQQMLPVQAINYTPPVGVVFIVNTYGSMTSTDNYGTADFDWAKASIAAGLAALTVRDFVGIVTMSSEATTILPMTARTQESTIHSAINSLEVNGDDIVYSSAIQTAGQLLLTCEGLAKYHIIMITDGYSSETSYISIIQNNYEKYQITFSIMGIGLNKTSSDYAELQQAVALGNGRLYTALGAELVQSLREELSVPDIKEVNYEQISIKIAPEYMYLFDIPLENLPILEGFYGTRLKNEATAILTGIYNVPIYAQWDYGKGTVGCFMCDLNGTWSKTFLQDVNGITIIETILYYIL